MIMYVITGIVFLLILANYYLGYKLYKEPTNDAYFSNVNNYNIINKKNIMASPRYVVFLSILFGLFTGIYIALSKVCEFNPYIEWVTILTLFVLYLIEITRKVSITDENLELEKLFSSTKKIPLNTIDGMFVYSYNKKFLNKRAFTTKLVVATGDKKHKFTLSSIDVRAIMNMMKENFGITENKMYVYRKTASEVINKRGI